MAKLLTRQEEKELSEKIQQGKWATARLKSGDYESFDFTELKSQESAGKVAYDKFFRHNMALVTHIAKTQYLGFSAAIDMEDLIQSGCIGLMTAIDKFDPSKGNKFSTMATWWIRQAIRRSANSTARLVRLPENRVNQLVKMSRLQQEHSSDLTEEEMRELIKTELDMTDEDISVIQSAGSTPTSLNIKISEGDEQHEYLDIIAEENADEITPDKIATGESLKRELVAIADSIGQRESDLILSFFEIPVEGKTLDQKEVQERYDMSKYTYRYSAVPKALNLMRKEMSRRNYSLNHFAEII